MNNLLSVIVPVYNVQNYINKCLDSIINQTYHNIEIIIIDDGSTDESGKICDQYSEEDDRICVIHSSNCGAIEARKKGVKAANGKVVTFVDSDDWIEPDMYENMMRVYNQYSPDIITSGFFYGELKDNCIKDLFIEGVYGKEQIRKEIIPRMMFDISNNTHGITPSLWNKLFKKDLIEKTIFSINKNISLGDDASVVYPSVAQAHKLYVMNDSWYHYVNNDNSMCHTCTIGDFEEVLLLQREFESIFFDLGIREVMDCQLKQYIRTVLAIVVKGVFELEMSNVSYVFPYEAVPKGSRVVLYGAGGVGKSYWQCLKNGKYATVVGWVDRNYKQLSHKGRFIENPDNISNLEFDYVVIAVLNEIKAQEIKEYLLQNKISESKIVWMAPVYVG